MAEKSKDRGPRKQREGRVAHAHDDSRSYDRHLAPANSEAKSSGGGSGRAAAAGPLVDSVAGTDVTKRMEGRGRGAVRTSLLNDA